MSALKLFTMSGIRNKAYPLTENSGVYVTAQALFSPTLYAYYEKVTFKDVKPFSKEELKATFDNNLKAEDELKGHLVESGFAVRGGHFREE